MRASPGPKTRTCPPLMAAISEFVVPRSIPTISSLIAFFRRPRAGHLHLRRTKHFAIPFIAAAVDFDHRARGEITRFFTVDRVHAPRIEHLAVATDLARVPV